MLTFPSEIWFSVCQTRRKTHRKKNLMRNFLVFCLISSLYHHRQKVFFILLKGRCWFRVDSNFRIFSFRRCRRFLNHRVQKRPTPLEIWCNGTLIFTVICNFLVNCCTNPKANNNSSWRTILEYPLEIGFTVIPRLYFLPLF